MKLWHRLRFQWCLLTHWNYHKHEIRCPGWVVRTHCRKCDWEW